MKYHYNKNIKKSIAPQIPISMHQNMPTQKPIRYRILKISQIFCLYDVFKNKLKKFVWKD